MLSDSQASSSDANFCNLTMLLPAKILVVDDEPEVANILGFYMGKNTPERKDYIMENLVVPVEE